MGDQFTGSTISGMDGQWSGWLTTADLLDGAHREGFTDLTRRRIESWRNQKLLPHPTRVAQDGLRPVWLSRPETLDQLITLCHLRDEAKRHRRTMNDTVLRIRLWLAGADTDLDQVRADLHAVVDDSERTIEVELDKVAAREQLTGTPAEVRREALKLAAEEVAGQRGEIALPPRSRSRSERPYRGHALHALLHLFWTGQAPDPTMATGEQVERGLGLLPRGRLDSLDTRVGWPDKPVDPWHDGTPIDLSLIASVVSLPALRQAIDHAADEDLLYARKATPILTRYLPAVVRGAAALSGLEEFLGLAALRRLPLADVDAGLAVVVLALRCSQLRNDLDMVVQAIDRAYRQLDQGLRALFGIPRQTLDERMARAEPKTARRVERLRNEFANSERSDPTHGDRRP